MIMTLDIQNIQTILINHHLYELLLLNATSLMFKLFFLPIQSYNKRFDKFK